GFALAQTRSQQHCRIHVSKRAGEVGYGITVERCGQDLGAEAMLSQHPADDMKVLETLTRNARRHEGRQFTVEPFVAGIFALQVTRQLTSYSREQAPIALIESFMQTQEQSSHCARFMPERYCYTFQRIDLSLGRQGNLVSLDRLIAE